MLQINKRKRKNPQTHEYRTQPNFVISKHFGAGIDEYFLHIVLCRRAIIKHDIGYLGAMSHSLQ